MLTSTHVALIQPVHAALPPPSSLLSASDGAASVGQTSDAGAGTREAGPAAPDRPITEGDPGPAETPEGDGDGQKPAAGRFIDSFI